MPQSTVSSEPLTSPTPSPPPSRRSEPPGAASHPPGFESDSELSDLSDDEVRKAGGSVQDEEEDDNKTGSMGSGKTRGRRKGGGVVPGAMWDWAYKTRKTVVPPDDDPRDSAPEDEHPEGKILDGGNIDPHFGGEEDKHEEHDSSYDRIQDHRLDDASVVGGDEEKDQGKGEDDMDIDSSEEEEENPDDNLGAAVDRPLDTREAIHESNLEAVTSSPHSNLGDLPAKEDVDVDAASEIDDEQDAEPGVEDSAAEEDDEDIASSRPSSPVTEGDIEMEPSPKPPMAKILPSSSLSAPMTVPVPVMHPSTEVDAEDDTPQDVDAEEMQEIEHPEQEDASRTDNEANDKPDVDVDVASPTPEPSSRSPTPEQDLLDLQPAHRAEALDALALIELKFALLREKVYIEKMDELLEEESMVIGGTHPELLHLQLELSMRRDKRLELAARRRTLEEASVRAQKRDDQSSVWEWWKHERDVLQTDMIAQHNRKRRKLERQRKSHERSQPQRRIPPPPQARHLPPAPSLASVLDFSMRTPYAFAFHGQRPARPGLSLLTPAELESDLGYITGGKRRFWSVDALGPSEGIVHANGTGGEVIGGFLGREVKERERERIVRPGSIFEQPQSQQFRMGLSMFGLSDESQGPGQNGWSKRRAEEDARTEHERERERAGQRQSILHPHPHQHPLAHHHQQQQQQQHLSHPHHSYQHGHQHIHSHPQHHPHPHHHHVHVHHHHHPTGPGGVSGSNGPAQPSLGYGEKPSFPLGGPGGPPSEKSTSLWRGADEVEVGASVRERERERDRDREREKKNGPSSSLGYERIMSSSFGPPSSPRHHQQQQQRHDSWDEIRPHSQPPSLGRSPVHAAAPGSSGRLPPPHALTHRPHSRQNSLGSPSRRHAPESPPQPPHSSGHGHSASNSSAGAGHLYPPSPRPLSINTVPVPPLSPSKASSSSRPLSPPQAKMISGPGSTPTPYRPTNSNNNNGGGPPASRRPPPPPGEQQPPFPPPAAQAPGSARTELFISGPGEPGRPPNLSERPPPPGSAEAVPYPPPPRERRDRVY